MLNGLLYELVCELIFKQLLYLRKQMCINCLMLSLKKEGKLFVKCQANLQKCNFRTTKQIQRSIKTCSSSLLFQSLKFGIDVSFNNCFVNMVHFTCP